ncbi:MAG: hypothetical protein PWP46_1428 [Fusobacteriaceae bacterium]|jgi:ribosomal 50S subunit-recycling heat shock protein|nr:RNA-binding domain protein [Fusobacteriales bacterium]MDN5304542.1 hypothetical protein [Fusobacteriaceae bacterium]
MRLDKFLKTARIIKRRPIAKKVADNKKIKINGKIAKSAANIKVGDILEVEYFNRYMKIEVLEVPKGNVKKEDASELIKVLETKKIETNELAFLEEDELNEEL